MTHSIAEPNGLAIRTPLGTVLHTGDWKIDPDPIIGEDRQAKIEKLGDEGMLAMVCDSTNVFVEGEAGSEGMAREALQPCGRRADGPGRGRRSRRTWRGCSRHARRRGRTIARCACWAGR